MANEELLERFREQMRLLRLSDEASLKQALAECRLPPYVDVDALRHDANGPLGGPMVYIPFIANNTVNSEYIQAVAQSVAHFAGRMNGDPQTIDRDTRPAALSSSFFVKKANPSNPILEGGANYTVQKSLMPIGFKGDVVEITMEARCRHDKTTLEQYVNFVQASYTTEP